MWGGPVPAVGVLVLGTAGQLGGSSCQVAPGTGQRRSQNVPSSERRKEIKRRRHRRKKLGQLARRLTKATVSERSAISEKIRNLTPGGREIVKDWGLEER